MTLLLWVVGRGAPNPGSRPHRSARRQASHPPIMPFPLPKQVIKTVIQAQQSSSAAKANSKTQGGQPSGSEQCVCCIYICPYLHTRVGQSSMADNSPSPTPIPHHQATHAAAGAAGAAAGAAGGGRGGGGAAAPRGRGGGRLRPCHWGCAGRDARVVCVGGRGA
jgi:hypothetical protein